MANDWQTVPISEIAIPAERFEKPIGGKSYRQIGVRLWGEGAYERESIDGGNTRYAFFARVEKDDIVVNKIWARNGSVAIVPEKLAGCYVSTEFPTFAPMQDRLFPRWFHWLTKTRDFWNQCDKKSRSTSGKNRIRPEQFLQIEISPPPLSEQQRIVARVDALARRVEEACGLRRAAVEEAEAVMDSAVGVTFGEVKAEQKSLAALASKIGSGSTPKGGRASYPSSGIPFIRSLNVRMRQFNWDGIAYIDSATQRTMSGTQVMPNDVLLNITGASIGRVACAPSDLVQANVNQHVTIIRPLEALDPRFLMYWLSQPTIQDFINDKQKGATRQGFTKSQIEQFEVPVPPLADQRRIVAYLDGLQAKVDELRRLQAATQKELDALMPSILAKAFAGEL